MKKLVVSMLVTALFLAMGVVGAQAQHDVEIRIPATLMIRITSGGGNGPAADSIVEFDFVAEPAAYLAAVGSATGDGALEPTAVSNFDDVIVLANRGTWRVSVSAGVLGFVNDVIASESAAGVALSDIRVEPSEAAGTNVTARSSGWNVTSGEIASGIRTQGWRSLGFGGGDYRLDVDGDEAPGTYTTTVTYTITAP